MSQSYQCLECGHRWEAVLSAAPCPQCGAEPRAVDLLAAVLQRLESLETRLAQVEEASGSKAPVSSPPAPEPSTMPPAADKPAVDAQAQAALVTWLADYRQRQWGGKPPPRPRSRPAARAAQPDVPVDPLAMERKIGLHWAAWLGAIIFVMGVGLGIKFALDNGWLNFITPALRLLLLALGGFVLITCGEWVYRRVQPLAAVGLFGAGIGVLFFAGFAGNIFYELYSTDRAFLFTALVALLGSGVAWRSGFVAVGILAQVGGNLAPILLAADQKPDLPFFGYIYLLEVFALLLVWWGAERKWWAVRLLSLFTTLFWINVCLDSRGAELAWGDSLFWFMLLAIATFHAEYLRSALQAEIVSEVDALQLREITRAGGTYLLGLTLSAAYFGLHLLEPVSSTGQGLFLGQLAACTTVVGLLLWRTGLQIPLALARNYGLQTITLLVLIIPVVLDGPWISLGWMLLGLAFTVWGAWQAYSMACMAGISAWLLSLINLARVLMQSASTDLIFATWATVFDEPLPVWLLCFLVEAAGGLALAMILQTWRLWPERVLPPFLEVARLVMALAVGVAVVAVHAGLPQLGATLAGLAIVGVLGLLRPLAPRLRLEVPLLAVVTLAVCKWLTLDSLVELERIAAQPLEREFLLNRFLAVGCVAIVTILAGLWVCKRRIRSMGRCLRLGGHAVAPGMQFSGLLAWVLALVLAVALSVELIRALGQLRARAGGSAWPPDLELWFSLLMLWSVLAMLLGEVLRRLQAAVSPVWHLLGVLAAAWALFGAILPRLHIEPPTGVALVGNLQFSAAAVILLAIGWTRYRNPASPGDRADWVLVAATLVLLTAGTLEVDRALPATAAGGLPIMAKHAGISVFWSLFAVGLVIVGFWRRRSWLRYFGLGLFAITLAKVGLVDLSGVAYGYRIISLLVLGLLLLGTSVLYGYLSPRLLALNGDGPEERAESAGAPLDNR